MGGGGGGRQDLGERRMRKKCLVQNNMKRGGP